METKILESAQAPTDTLKTKKPARDRDAFEQLADSYQKHYPSCDEFHITTDKQVFLKTDLSLATLHQRSIGEGKVRTIKPN